MAKIRVDPPFSGFVKTAYFCLIRRVFILGFESLIFQRLEEKKQGTEYNLMLESAA
jgi:hypothetical protein